jgi:hypothetical protein
MKKLEILGKRFNHLLVIEESERKWYNRYFLCKCDCWNTRDILMHNITSWKNSSCWCYFRQKNIIVDIRRRKIYRCWIWIIQRTTNIKLKQYNDWGWRWIQCEWKNFDEFYNDMKESWKEWLSLDRINNDGHYSKENCRWATREEQNSNTRSNILVRWLCLKQYCRVNNLNYWAINMRINKLKWDIQKSINTPIQLQNHTKLK